MKPNPGTDQHANHRTGNLTAPIVAAFRSNTETLSADGFENGDTSAWSASTPLARIIHEPHGI